MKLRFLLLFLVLAFSTSMVGLQPDVANKGTPTIQCDYKYVAPAVLDVTVVPDAVVSIERSTVVDASTVCYFPNNAAFVKSSIYDDDVGYKQTALCYTNSHVDTLHLLHYDPGWQLTNA